MEKKSFKSALHSRKNPHSRYRNAEEKVTASTLLAAVRSTWATSLPPTL